MASKHYVRLLFRYISGARKGRLSKWQLLSFRTAWEISLAAIIQLNDIMNIYKFNNAKLIAQSRTN